MESRFLYFIGAVRLLDDEFEGAVSVGSEIPQVNPRRLPSAQKLVKVLTMVYHEARKRRQYVPSNRFNGNGGIEREGVGP
jgi:hypothetical protein